MEPDNDPGPVPGELTDEQYANLHNTIDVTHFVFAQMLQDLGNSGSVSMMCAPFQPLVRAVMIAAVAYYRDHDSPELAQRAQALLDSGLLDSPSVARAPTAQEVEQAIITRNTGESRLSIIADAMDCVYKQAIAAPQTHGSRFARKEG
jgi:hypothetical protein